MPNSRREATSSATDPVADIEGLRPNGVLAAYWCLCRRRAIVLTALRVSLFVGTVLNLINQGHKLWAGEPISWWQVFFNFAVPYCVSTYSAVRVEYQRQKKDEGGI